VEIKERALGLYREKYSDYGPTLAAECLRDDDGLDVPVSTLRGWLLEAGLWEKKRRRRLHRHRRPRREHAGELVQMDGSRHDWFEGRREWATLMTTIDDATGEMYARFFENESLASAYGVFRGYVAWRGLMGALYVDRASIYRADREATPEELAAGVEPETQFGRAMRELGVELILARSPQAKGRVERLHGTLQDRLVKALRRKNISTLEAANEYLDAEFLSDFNRRFGRPAKSPADQHRPLEANRDLDVILCVRETRVVQNDWTVRWHNQFLQLPRSSATVVGPGEEVAVCETMTGQLRLFIGEQELSWSAIRSESAPRKCGSRTGPTGSSQGQKPAANHPWRRGFGSGKMPT
jgi:hypothetical protein